MLFGKKIEKLYKAQIYSRCDDSGRVKYFTHEDFKGLMAAPYEFKSSLGHTLRGYFYSYEGAEASPLVIFEHGLGGGHLSYMKEIEMLCSKGYTVFSYDHTGCMMSGGDSTNGLAQSLHDLDDCLTALKNDGSVNTESIYVMGHSWGGFSAMNIAAFHPDVKKAVVLSGFIAPVKIIEQNFRGILKLYRKHIMSAERSSNPRYADICGVDTLKGSDVHALLIYSDNDPIVTRELNYDILEKELRGRANTVFRLERGKGHNPNYSENAVALLGELAKRIAAEAKDLKTDEDRRKFRDSFDWEAMSEQDGAVWGAIFDFLESEM